MNSETSTTTIHVEEKDLNSKTDDEILQEEINEYISTLNEREKLVLEIAKEHLESSFCIERSVGFVKWKNSKK